MAKRFLIALVLPVTLQVMGILIYQRRDLNLLETAREFTSAALLFSFFWCAQVVIPLAFSQFLCAIALARSNCSDRTLFLAGSLNPALALFVIMLAGWISMAL